MMQLRWLLLIAVCLFSVCSVHAEDAAEEANTEWIDGKLEVVKGAEGKIESAMVVYEETNENDQAVKVKYNVVLDKVGTEMAEKLAGKDVEVTAVVANKGTEEKPEYWMTVKSYQEIKAEAAE